MKIFHDENQNDTPSSKNTSIDRSNFKIISVAASQRLVKIQNIINDYDWKINSNENSNINVKKVETVMIIPTSYHLVDRAFREFRSFIVKKGLFYRREKLSKDEECCVVPKITHSGGAYFMAVATSAALAKHAIAIERKKLRETHSLEKCPFDDTNVSSISTSGENESNNVNCQSLSSFNSNRICKYKIKKLDTSNGTGTSISRIPHIWDIILALDNPTPNSYNDDPLTFANKHIKIAGGNTIRDLCLMLFCTKLNISNYLSMLSAFKGYSLTTVVHRSMSNESSDGIEDANNVDRLNMSTCEKVQHPPVITDINTKRHIMLEIEQTPDVVLERMIEFTKHWDIQRIKDVCDRFRLCDKNPNSSQGIRDVKRTYLLKKIVSLFYAPSISNCTLLGMNRRDAEELSEPTTRLHLGNINQSEMADMSDNAAGILFKKRIRVCKGPYKCKRPGTGTMEELNQIATSRQLDEVNIITLKRASNDIVVLDKKPIVLRHGVCDEMEQNLSLQQKEKTKQQDQSVSLQDAGIRDDECSTSNATHPTCTIPQGFVDDSTEEYVGLECVDAPNAASAGSNSEMSVKTCAVSNEYRNEVAVNGIKNMEGDSSCKLISPIKTADTSKAKPPKKRVPKSLTHANHTEPGETAAPSTANQSSVFNMSTTTTISRKRAPSHDVISMNKASKTI